MLYTTDCQARYFDIQRDLAWANSEAWKFAQPRPRRGLRSLVTRICIAVTRPLGRPVDEPTTA